LSASVASPRRAEEEFRSVLSNLGADQILDSAAAHYWTLGEIIGKWLAELEERTEASPIAKALLSTARNLNEVSRLLSGRETGFRTSVEIGVTNETIKYLALDPSLDPTTPASDFIAGFARDAARLAHVCMVAYKAQPDRSAERGRPALDWYDDFTALLLKIADEAGIEPTLRKHRTTGGRGMVRSGWAGLAGQEF